MALLGVQRDLLPHSCSKTSKLPDCERKFNVINKELSLAELTFESGCVGAYDTVNYQILDELKMGFKQFHENMTDQGQ